MDILIKSYDEFLNERKKYDGNRCYVQPCNKPAYYEGGDARFYCAMCEEHVGMKHEYRSYLKGIENKIRIRMAWCKDDPTLETLYKTVIGKLKEWEP